MTDIAKVKYEIERRIESLKVVPGQGMMLVEGTRNHLKDLLSYVESIEPISLTDLDEACNKWVDENEPHYPDISWDTCDEKMTEAFRAGAEWCASQGNSFYYDLKGRNTIENLDMYALRKAGIEFGDRILVQIRKV